MTTRRIDIGKGGIKILSAIADLPRWPEWVTTREMRAQLVEEEEALRDDLAAYAYHMGTNDIDKVVQHFSDDAVLTSHMGSLSGMYLIRKNYEHILRNNPSPRHLWGNVLIRFIDSLEEAYRTSFIHEMWGEFNPTFGVGTDLHRMKKIGGRWKIVERIIGGDSDYKLEPERPTAAAEEEGRRKRAALIAQWTRDRDTARPT